MAWPWAMIFVSDAEKDARRQALDAYGTCALLSALGPAAAFLVLRLAEHILKSTAGRQAAYTPIPRSTPQRKRRGPTAASDWETAVRKLSWWLGNDVRLWGQTYGQRDQWVAGVGWTLWLLFLSIHGTGNDYLHLTKRFGIIAASQVPVQYLLALKSLNPFAFAFRSSHERVNRWHRVLGRIIYGLLCCHATLYLNFFVQMGLLQQRLLAPVVLFGVTAFTALSLLETTALSRVRHYSYRVFFVCHVLVAFALPILIFFHAGPASTYMVVAFLALAADIGIRQISRVTSEAIFEAIPGTNLIKVSASLPFAKINRFRALPGAHVFLNIPGAARGVSNPVSLPYILFEFLHNPFTVADVDDRTNSITLVARHRDGPLTAALARFAGAASRQDKNGDGKLLLLNVDGPYGAMIPPVRLDGEEFDRVLLVAGGVGATYIVPIYRFLKNSSPTAKVEMVWAVRSPGDATWATGASSMSKKGLLDDDAVSIFVTDSYVDAGPMEPAPRENGLQLSHDVDGGDGEIELTSVHRDRRRNRFIRSETPRRPDLKKIVDETFKHGNNERVAVIVCGPESMAAELKYHVGVWAMRGRSVYWHSEAFGW